MKSYLSFVLSGITQLKELDEPQQKQVTDLIELYDELMGIQEKRAFWTPVPDCTHVHIVIGHSFAGSMKQALKQLDWAHYHKVIIFEENYSIGPLIDVDLPKGRKARSDWFRNNIVDAFTAYTEIEEEYIELVKKIASIPEGAKVIIWASSNVCEQAGMRHALNLLRNKRNKIAIYDACNICEKLSNGSNAKVDYLHSGEISSTNLQEALLRMDDSSELGSADITQLVQQWQSITKQKEMLRIWKEGAVIGVSADYYDQYLLEKLDHLKTPAGENGFLRATRLIGEAIAYCDQYIGDSYFEYRLRELIYDGVLEISGLPAAMRFYSIRRKLPRNNDFIK